MKKIKIKSVNATFYPEKKSILFWRGIFSQWHQIEYDIDINGVNYTVKSAEQAMMLFKASLFNDKETLEKILIAKTPREQKEFGRQVKNFNLELWNKNALDFVSYSNYKKFKSNDELKHLIIMTYPNDLVEASPIDRIWGIGYSEDDPNVFNQINNWGTNLLGKALVNARDKIISEKELDDMYKVTNVNEFELLK